MLGHSVSPLRSWRIAAALLFSAAAHVVVLNAVGHESVHGARPRAQGSVAQRLSVSIDQGRDAAVAPHLPPAGLKLDDQLQLNGPVARQKSGLAVSDAAGASVAQKISAYVPVNQADAGPIPSSSPDYALLSGVAPTAFPVRLRVFVDKTGQVANVEVLDSIGTSEDTVEKLRSMFLGTGYLPARKAGLPIATFVDIEFQVLSKDVEPPFHPSQ